MKSRISCSVSSLECTEESSRATCRSARSWKTASSSWPCRSSSTPCSSSTTESPSAIGVACPRSSSATAGSARMATSVSPLDSRITSRAPSPVGRGEERHQTPGESTWNQIRSLPYRRTSASRQRSNSSLSVLAVRHAAAKALGSEARAESAVGESILLPNIVIAVQVGEPAAGSRPPRVGTILPGKRRDGPSGGGGVSKLGMVFGGFGVFAGAATLGFVVVLLREARTSAHSSRRSSNSSPSSRRSSRPGTPPRSRDRAAPTS